MNFIFKTPSLSTILILLVSVLVGFSAALIPEIGDAARPGEKPQENIDFPWTWTCVLETIDGPSCQRQLFNTSAGHVQKVPLNICWLTCGPHGSLWPYPSGNTVIGPTLTGFSSKNLLVTQIFAPDDKAYAFLIEAVNIFVGNIKNVIPEDVQESDVGNNSVDIKLTVRTASPKHSLDVDESYSLNITRETQGTSDVVKVEISGETFYGVRHGLETLTQLIDFNTELGFLQVVNSVSIEDKPVFRYRGVLIDSGRNFVPFSFLKRVVDGLSYNKMNVLHWHITDSNSFPFYSKSATKVTQYGALDSSKIYRVEEIKEFLEYAYHRGVKVIPELDAPSHAGNGWQWGAEDGLGDLSLCVNFQPYRDYCIQPPCGQLNPLNPYMYSILGDLFKDFLEVFDRDIFHMGGDEISFTCWMAYPEIRQWLVDHNSTDLMDLWGIFQETALAKLRTANGGKHIDAIVWTSEMTNRARQYLSPDDYIIQVWSNSTDTEAIKEILDENYRVIFSNNNTMYLDHGFGPWRGTQNKALLIFWQTLYGHDILGMVENHVGKEKMEKMYEDGQILGGEAPLWAEKVDEQNLETKLWPRAAALGERLWSNPAADRTRFAYPRLIHQRQRMVQRGIPGDALVPEACYYIWGFCDDADT